MRTAGSLRGLPVRERTRRPGRRARIELSLLGNGANEYLLPCAAGPCGRPKTPPTPEAFYKHTGNDSPYQHEMNDALVKAHLTNIQFAKDHSLLKEMIDHEVKTQTPMIVRVGKMIREGGSPELATIALTERTACFYQLVQDYQRTGTTMRWRSPFGNVLNVTRQLGQHDPTEQEIHEVYTVPLMQKQAEVMGMQVTISPWQADGWVTMTVKAPEKVAAR